MKLILGFFGLVLSFQVWGQEVKLGLPVGHTKMVIGLDLNKDESLMVTWSRDNTIKIWDVESTKLLLNLQENGRLGPVELSPNKKKVAARFDSSIIIWNIESGERIFEVTADTNSIFKFSQDSKMIAYTKYDTVCVVNNLFNDVERFEFKGESITSIQFQERKTSTILFITENGEKTTEYFLNENQTIKHEGVVNHFLGDKFLITESKDFIKKVSIYTGEIVASYEKESPFEKIISNVSDSGKALLANIKKFNIYPLNFEERKIVKGNSIYSSNSRGGYYKSALITPDGSVAAISFKNGDTQLYRVDDWSKGSLLKNATLLDIPKGTKQKLVDSKLNWIFIRGSQNIWALDVNSMLETSEIGIKLTSLKIQNNYSPVYHISKNFHFFGLFTVPGEEYNYKVLEYVKRVPLHSYQEEIEGSLDLQISVKKYSSRTTKEFEVLNASSDSLLLHPIIEEKDTVFIFNLDLLSGKTSLIKFPNLKSKNKHFWSGWNYDLVQNGKFKYTRGIQIESPEGETLNVKNRYRSISRKNVLNRNRVFFDSKGKQLFVSHKRNIDVINCVNQKRELQIKRLNKHAKISHDIEKNQLLIVSRNKLLLYDLKTNSRISKVKISGLVPKRSKFKLSPNRRLLSVIENYSLKVYNAESGNLLFEELETQRNFDNQHLFFGANFSKDNQHLSFRRWKYFSPWSSINIVDLYSGQTSLEVTDISDNGNPLNPSFPQQPFFYSINEVFIVKNLSTIERWNYSDSTHLASLYGHSGSINYLQTFNSDFLISLSEDGSACIWRIEDNRLMIKHFYFDNDPSKWVHIHPSGLFDASPEAMELMYWTKGLEVIEFEQLKDRYWVPGLWEKVMKGEQLPDVRDINKLKLQPEVSLGEIKNGKLPITLTKREGGYGQVSIFINGKEVAHDARGNDLDTTQTVQTINYSIKDHPYLKNGKNTITVKASSADGFVQGRGVSIESFFEEDKKEEPSFYGVVIGVSDYANDHINLAYPVKDAEAMATSITMGADNLFGSDHTHVYSLTSKSAMQPTKENIEIVFNEIAQEARAEDVIMVYLSGHGVTWGNGTESDFYFLTSDATAANKEAYGDPQIRKSRSVSTNEFVEYLKAIPALKQVMIIDACGSGQAVETLIAARDVDGSQIKAIDRMKDRTGMYIISGCTADAVSYEASQYGQGLLTYSVLEAMQGAALKENKYVDVFTIMDHARERVPKLAENIGGVQTPQLLAPKGGSFDIGILEDKDKEAIPLASPKTVFVRSTVINIDEGEDNLELSDAIDEQLGTIASKGVESKIVFFDAKKFPNACKISGTYTEENGVISFNMKVRCGEEKKSYELEGSSKEELVEKIVETVGGI